MKTVLLVVLSLFHVLTDSFASSWCDIVRRLLPDADTISLAFPVSSLNILLYLICPLWYSVIVTEWTLTL